MNDGQKRKKAETRFILCIVFFYVLVLAAFSFPPTSEFAVNATLLK